MIQLKKIFLVIIILIVAKINFSQSDSLSKNKTQVITFNEFKNKKPISFGFSIFMGGGSTGNEVRKVKAFACSVSFRYKYIFISGVYSYGVEYHSKTCGQHENINDMEITGYAILGGAGLYKKWYSVSAGFGGGNYMCNWKTAIYQLIPTCSGHYKVYDYNNKCLSFHVQASITPLKWLGISAQLFTYSARPLNNYAITFGLVLGKLR